MPKVEIYTMDGSKKGDITLSEDVFGIEPNASAIHQVVTAQLANKRQGTQSALTRSEVRGGGAKPWRQKGTGRARHGSTRSPIWRHGGVSFAPKPRSYRKSINKKVKRLAMKSALSAKVASGDIIVLDALSLEAPKTKDIKSVLSALNAEGKALIVMTESNENIDLSVRNIPGVKTTVTNTLNVYEILNFNKLIITEDAVKMVEEVYA